MVEIKRMTRYTPRLRHESQWCPTGTSRITMTVGSTDRQNNPTLEPSTMSSRTMPLLQQELQQHWKNSFATTAGG